VGCHLPNGVCHQRYPRLAGQLQTYIVQQLVAFKSGARSNDRARVMRAVAGRFTDEEMKLSPSMLPGCREIHGLTIKCARRASRRRRPP
jgi:hypothetical protein